MWCNLQGEMIFFCLDVSNEIWALWLFRVYRCFIGDYSTQSYRDYSTVTIFFLKIAICGVFGCLKILKGDGDFGDAKGKKKSSCGFDSCRLFSGGDVSPNPGKKWDSHRFFVTQTWRQREVICRNATDLKNEACQKGHLVGLEIFWFIIYHGFWVFWKG